MARPPTVSRPEVLHRMRKVFRAHGYDGATLTTLSETTGLARAALYHLYPEGKQQMAAAVLEEQKAWSLAHILAPLRQPGDPAGRLRAMTAALDELYRGGHEPCLIGLFSSGEPLRLFSSQLEAAVSDLIAAIRDVLLDAGIESLAAALRAEDAVVRIQGALVVSRALQDTGPFERTLAQLAGQLLGEA